MPTPTFETARSGYSREQVDLWVKNIQREMQQTADELVGARSEMARIREEARGFAQDRDGISRTLLLAQRTADATVKDAVERATTEANRARVALLAEITELEGRRDKLTRYVTGLDETFAKRQQWLLDTLDRFRKAVEEGDLQDMIADNPVASWDEQLGLDSANMSPLAAILSVPDKA